MIGLSAHASGRVADPPRWLSRWPRVSRWLGLIGLVGLYLTVAGFRPAGLIGDDLAAVPVSAQAADALNDLSGPTLNARGAILVDEPSGTILWSQHATTRLPMASTTKLMTALLVVETGRYFDQVTIEAGDLIGGSTMGLVNGDVLSVRDLLDGLLLPSGNDASMALARHFGNRLAGPGRPVARFVARMNGRAAELGLKDSAFRNPSGLDERDHFSSAQDLATLTRLALRQPVIAQIVAQSSASVRGARQHYQLRSTNQLFQRLPGTLGVKTGTTDAAGECLVALVERSGARLLAVVLGSGDRYAETSMLLEWGFEQHRWLSLPASLADVAVPGGVANGFGAEPALVVPASQQAFVEYRPRVGVAGSRSGVVVDAYVLGRLVATRSVEVVRPGRMARPLAE